MSKPGKWGFGLPRGMVWRDLGITERVGSFLDAIRAADQNYAAGAYERGLPVRAAQQTPGKWGFGLPKGMVWKDLGITERLNPTGALEARKNEPFFQENLANIIQKDTDSGLFDRKSVTGRTIFPSDYKPPVVEGVKGTTDTVDTTGGTVDPVSNKGTGKDGYTVGQKVTAFLNNQSPETRYGENNYGGNRIPLPPIVRAQDYERRRNRFELTPEEQKTTIMSPLEQEMYW
tara:strand:+ start:1725 stop:2417 length:693 start_codon:yes stop_codon:yes gene_type:complete